MSFRYLAAAKSLGKATLLGNVKYLILHVTPICNAKCRFCFNADGMDERRDANTLTLGEIQRLAKSVGTLPQLTLSGGEPTLRKDTIDILRAFYEHAETRFFTIPTNALLPNRVEELIEQFQDVCPKGFFNLCLPFHGDEETYDNQMGVPGNFRKFKKTYEIIEDAKQRYTNISGALVCVISKFNHEHAKKIVDLSHAEFPGMPLGLHYARGITRERDARDFPIEAYEDIYDYELSRKTSKSRRNPYTVVQEAIQQQMKDTIAGVVKGEITNLDCKAGKNFLVIYDDGSVFPCELIDVVGMPPGDGAPAESGLGNIRTFDCDLRALLASDHARRVIEWIDTHDCACTWECAIFSKIINTPSKALRLSIEAVEYMLKPSPAARAAEQA